MKFIKNNDSLVLFSEVNNHGEISALLHFRDVQTAGFASLFPTQDKLKISLGGQSHTLKVMSNRIEDTSLAEKVFKFTEQDPVAFLVDQFDNVFFFAKQDGPLIEQRLSEAWPGANFISGTLSVEIKENTDRYVDSNWKAVPKIIESSSPLSDTQLDNIASNLKPR